MLKKLFAVSLIGASLTLAACSAPLVETNKPSETITASNLLQLQQSAWMLTHLGTTQVNTDTNATNLPSLQFDANNRVSGADGCNRIMGGYNAGLDTLSFTPLAGTRMACPDKNYVPEKFNQALAKVTHYQVYNKTLKLLDRSGNVLLQFENAVKPRA